MADNDNLGPGLQAAASTFFALAAVTLLLRCYVRLRIAKAFGLDDWFMVVSTIFYALNTSSCLAGVKYGTGQHYWNLQPADLSVATMFWWYCYLSYAWSMIFSKASIAVFLMRITPNRSHRLVIYCALGVSIFCGLVFFFVALFQCTPVSYFWTRTGPGSCISIDIIINVVYAYSALSIVTDFTFTLLPVYLVWNLQMDRRVKFALIPILSMGCVASCAVAVRMAYLENFHSNDFLYSTTDIAIWSQIEMGLAIAAGSLATLRPLMKMTLRRLGFTGAEDSNQAPSSAGLRTFGQGSSKSSFSRKTPKSLFSMTTFTKMEEEPEEEQTIIVANKHDLELGGEAQPGTRVSLRNDKHDYRVQVKTSNGDGSKWARTLGETEEDIQGITKKTSFQVD